MSSKTVVEVTQQYFDSLEKLYKGKSAEIILKDVESFVYNPNIKVDVYNKEKIAAICKRLELLLKEHIEKSKEPSKSEKIIMELYNTFVTNLGVKNANPK